MEQEELYYTHNNNKLKCVICFEDHNNVSYKLLNKMCICEDSLICSDCIGELQNNKIIKCPVCRRSLSINRSYFILTNIYIFIKFNKILIAYLFNILITNLVIYYLFYSNGKYIPNDLYNNIDELNSNNKLLIKKIILLNKNSFFIINNLIIIVCYPIITQVCNNVLYVFNTRRRLELINYILFILLLLNLILITILFIYNTINGLIMYYQFNIFLYSLYSSTVFSIYVFNYLIKKFNFIKNNYMKFNIEYNILNKIYYILDNNEHQDEHNEDRDEHNQNIMFINGMSVV